MGYGACVCVGTPACAPAGGRTGAGQSAFSGGCQGFSNAGWHSVAGSDFEFKATVLVLLFRTCGTASAHRCPVERRDWQGGQLARRAREVQTGRHGADRRHARLVSPSGMFETPRLQTKSRLRSVRGANTSGVYGTEALHVRHARAGGHPGCSARGLDSRFRENDGGE